MGFPFGADEDAAFIISWLELNNLNGLKVLVNSLNKIDKKYNGKILIKNNEFEIDLNDSSILMKGPGLIDYFTSKLDKNKDIEIIINNFSDEQYFFPLLYKLSNRIAFSRLIYLNSKNQKKMCVFKKNLMQIGLTSKKIEIKKNQLKILISEKNKSLSFDNIQKEITPTTIQKKLSRSVNIDIKYWKIIEKIALRTYVPETNESRLKGAGGGDANE